MARANNLRLKFCPVMQSQAYSASPGTAGIVDQVDDPAYYLAWIFQAIETDLITHVGLRIYDVTNSPTYRISLRSVGPDGLPLDTIITSASFTPTSAWDGTFQWIELVSPYLVSRGQVLSIVVDYLSGVISSSNLTRICPTVTKASSNRWRFPYYLTNKGTVTRSIDYPLWALKSETRCYGIPIKSRTSYVPNTPGQAGLRFRLDPGFGSSFTLKGIVIEVDQIAASAGKTFDVVLYDFTTEIDRITFQCDLLKTVTNNAVAQIFFGASPPTLNFGKEYFVVISGNEADTGCQLVGFSVENATDMTAWPGSTSFYTVERADVTDPWTRVKTERPMIDLIIDDWTAG
jgi:hypothetical protein